MTRPAKTTAPRRPDRCLNCETPLTDRFCAACGQDNRAARLTIRGICRHVTDEVFDFELPILRTLLGLTIRPGSVCLEYIRGRRKRYSNPLRYLLIMAAVFVIGFLMSDVQPANLGTPGSSQLTAAQQQRLDEYAVEIMNFVVGSYTYLVLLSVPVVAVMMKLLFFPERRNFAEHLVFVMFVEAQRLLATAILTPFGFLDRPLPRIVLEVVLFLYFFWAAMVFYERGRILRIVRAATAAIGARLVVIMLVAVVLIGLKIIPDIVSGRFESIMNPPLSADGGAEAAPSPGEAPDTTEPP